jgi:lysophospholipase L1-like esterase
MKRFIAATTMLILALGLGGCARGLLDQDEMVYVAVGASDAFGVGAIPITNGYVFEIRDELENRGRDVALVNLGLPGANPDRIDNAVRIFQRTGVTADLVTVWVGANDLIAGVPVDAFADELDELLDRLQSSMEAFVVMANLPDLTDLPRFEDQPDPDVTAQRVADFNAVITAEAAERSIPLVDLFSIGIEDDLVSDLDGFHPNNEGHQRIADLFLDIILDEL